MEFAVLRHYCPACRDACKAKPTSMDKLNEQLHAQDVCNNTSRGLVIVKTNAASIATKTNRSIKRLDQAAPVVVTEFDCAQIKPFRA